MTSPRRRLLGAAALGLLLAGCGEGSGSERPTTTAKAAAVAIGDTGWSVQPVAGRPVVPAPLGADQRAAISLDDDGTLLIDAGGAPRERTAAVAADGRTIGARTGDRSISHALAFGRGEAVFLRASPASGSARPREVGVSFGRADLRTLGTVQPLSPGGREVYGTALAVGRGGDALVAFSRSVPRDLGDIGQADVRVAWRSAEGPRRIGRSRTLVAGPEAEIETVAVGPDGDALVVLARSDPGGYRAGRALYALVARRIDVRSGRVAAEQVLARDVAGVLSCAASVAADGSAIVAWDDQDLGEEANRRARHRAVTLGRDGGSRPVRLLDQDGVLERPTGGAFTALDDDGHGLVGWSRIVRTIRSHDDAEDGVQARVAAVDGGRIGPPRTLLRHATVAGLASTSRSSAVALRGLPGDVTDPDPSSAPIARVGVRSGARPLGPLTDLAGHARTRDVGLRALGLVGGVRGYVVPLSAHGGLGVRLVGVHPVP